MGSTTVESIEIEKLAHGGDGLGYMPDGRVLFVEGGVPGDVVDVELSEDKGSWARGRVASVRQESEHRVDVECDAFDRGCGGCQFWHVDYQRELEWKVDAAAEAMKRISGLDMPTPKTVAAPSVRDYRNRVTYHQRYVDGTLRRGFFAQKTGDVVAVDRCPVARPALDEAIAELGQVLDMLGEAEISVETCGEGKAVALIELRPGQSIERDHLDELALRVEQGRTVSGVEILDEDGDYYIIGDTTVAAGEVLAMPPVEGMRIESGRFRQANTAVNRRMVEHVRDVVDGTWERPRILELFSGAGNFSFALAPIADRLLGVEGSEGAVETARRIAELAPEMDHVRFEVGDLSDVDVVSQALDEPFEVLVVDPPRQGADVVARELARLDRGGQIIYISCDAACLARDAATLAESGWRVDELTCFDMFPRTAHLETVAIFERTETG